MAAPTYNCPFSANAAGAGTGASNDALTCAEVIALNSNASCALYDTKDEQCMFRQKLLSDKELWRGKTAD